MSIALTTQAVWAAASTTPTLLVFTDRAHPVTHAVAGQVIWLDAPTELQARLTSQLPKQASAATAEFGRRLLRHPEFQRELATAYQGVVNAWNLGVAAVPAVVVDNRYVVYGEPDVARAVADVAAYRSIHP
ncbi:TIGR03757 family integrating conjugative element protein [Burkholderia cepacia]|uniref:TIGR03757 family integrating conjugative element protein n=1 Tax=Burkholderia cepacia TaxID=292 RepID=UPI00158BC564|nr:TIGR03757 family integrating conjugative element protein [Burkholderia cepacia]